MTLHPIDFFRNYLVAPIVFVASKANAAIGGIAASALSFLTACYTCSVSLKNRLFKNQTPNPPPAAQAVDNAAQLALQRKLKVSILESYNADLKHFFKKGLEKLANERDLLEIFRSAYNNGIALMEECYRDGADERLTREIHGAVERELQLILGFLDRRGTEDEKFRLAPLRFRTEFNALVERGASKDEYKALFEANRSILSSEITITGGSILHHIAIIGKPFEVIPILADYELPFDKQEYSSFKNTPLMWAIANANNTLALEFIQHTLNLNLECCGNTPLVLAAAKGYKDKTADGDTVSVSNFALMCELVRFGADVKIPGQEGMTPLHIAYLRRDEEMIKFLIENGARKDVRNSKGEQPEQMAKKTYAEACAILNRIAVVYLLDKALFPESI